jgi:phosphoglycerol transferase MdoB-like AlkP superfamily enzyme
MKEILNNINLIEFIGVFTRILSFTILSVMGKDSPFLLIWIINSIDAMILLYCSCKRKNKPYMLMNTFWLIVGIIGIINCLK